MPISSIIKNFCENNHIILNDTQLLKFEQLTDLLLDYNSHTNLTAITNSENIALRHYIDSITPLCFDIIPQGASVIDIGCGAGFPGLPLKIMRPDISISFLDSTEKKLRFTKKASEVLGIDAEFYPKRAEEEAFGTKRESFDVAVSRAVASLPVLLELSLPFVRKDGIMIAFKSKKESVITDEESELYRSKNALSVLGAELQEVKFITLPKTSSYESMTNALIIIKKTKKLSTNYPRRYAQILKNPL